MAKQKYQVFVTRYEWCPNLGSGACSHCMDCDGDGWYRPEKVPLAEALAGVGYEPCDGIIHITDEDGKVCHGVVRTLEGEGR